MPVVDLDWGGHSVLAAPNTYTLGRIAQNGVEYERHHGNVDIPWSWLSQQLGDFNCNGTVEGADLTLLLNNWAKPIPATTIPGWTGIPQPTAPAIDGDELTALLSHWAQHTPGAGAGASTLCPSLLPS